MRRLGVALSALALAAALAGPPVAEAHGDPASDTLLAVDAFLPFMPPVSGPVGRRLSATLVAAKKRGKPIKVAVIASAPDLGSVSSLFGRPQKYAEFLSREHASTLRTPILVVMAKGFGFAKVGRELDLGFTKDVRVPSGATSDQLATAATEAVARYSGTRAAAPSDDGSMSGYVVAGLILGGLILAGVGIALLFRSRRAETSGA